MQTTIQILKYGLIKKKKKQIYLNIVLFVGTPCTFRSTSLHYTQSLLRITKIWLLRIINKNSMFQLYKSSLVTQGRNLMCFCFFTN